MRIAIILALLLLSLEREEVDDFVELMQLIQSRDDGIIHALAKLQAELNYELDKFIELMRLLQNRDEKVLEALTNLQAELSNRVKI